jgi:hypothetical protein
MLWQSGPNFQGPSSFFGTSNVNPMMPSQSVPDIQGPSDFVDESNANSTLPMR